MSSDPRPGGDPVEPSQLVGAVRVVRERWPLILAVTVICTLLMVALSLTATKQYESTSSLLLSKSDLTALINPNASNDSDPARDLGTNLQLVTSGTVAERAAKTKG